MVLPIQRYHRVFIAVTVHALELCTARAASAEETQARVTGMGPGIGVPIEATDPATLPALRPN